MCGPGKLWLVLYEREEELGLMADLLARVASSGGRVVLIRGEAGIGKSVLVREFIKTRTDDTHIYFGSCDDLLTPQPLGPLLDIAQGEPRLAEALADGDRSAVLATSLDLLSGLLRPNIMVLEDTHWADEATLDVIKYLGRRIAKANGLLLLTYRDGEVDYDHPLRQVIGELPAENLVRMHLDNLSTKAISDLVGDSDLDVDRVHILTDGNPLFVTEVIASGVENVPSSVQDSVLARASKLSAEARQLLDLVSVIPGEAEQTLIEHIVGSTEEHRTECARQGLLRFEADTVAFLHELTRQAVESALSASDRRRLNAEVLAELGGLGDLARLVHHARESDDVDSIVKFAPKAAKAAMAIESHREASAHFRTLEPYLDRIRVADRGEIVDDWARNEFYLDNKEANDILAKAVSLHRSSGDDLALARALTFAVRVNEVNGRPESADACAAEAVAILKSYPPSEGLAFAVSQLAWLSMMRGDSARAIELADQAIDFAEKTGDELTMIYALNTKGSETYMRGDAAGFRLLEEARTRAEQNGYPFEEIRALLNMTSTALELREVERAGDLAQRTRDTAARYENRLLEAHGKAQYGEVLSWKGEWAAAEDTVTEVLRSHPHTDILAGRVLGRLQARQGRPEAQATLDRVWSLAEPTAEMQNLVPTAAAQAEYLWLTGEDNPTQIVRFHKVLEDGLSLGTAWPVGDLAFWLWKLGELSHAPEGIAEPYRLVLEGEPLVAAEIWAELGLPYERAIALSHGDQTAKLEALENLEMLGALAVAAKLRKSLRDEGAVVPRGKNRHTRRHAAGLTARQAEVLRLLDEGLSNIEIADRLFLSPRTVENHVSAVLTKLDSSTRDEAVSRARTEGFLTTSGAPSRT